MNSAPSSASASGAKSLNLSSSFPLAQQQNSQTGSPSCESGPRRAASHATPVNASPRNQQGNRKKHKNARKPRLADEDAMAESGVMRNTNSRRGQTSITHLMSFALPPRPQDHRSTFVRGTGRASTFGIGSGHHSSDKARYIHANYRFIVKPDGDYKRQAINADQHLDWNDVLQILASSVSQEASCPICLSHPVAPRMAKCGHIFCLPCLIRYMHSTDDVHPLPEKKARCKKCPICWDLVFISDTRPVRWYTGQESPPPREGDDVVLRLVMRQPGSTLALPRDGAESLPKSEDIPWYFAAEVTDYARIMKGSEDYMQEQYNAEIEDLQRQENEDELMFGEEPEWTRKAVDAVREAKKAVDGIGQPPAIPKQPAEKKPKKLPLQFPDGVEGASGTDRVRNAPSGPGVSASASSTSSPAHPSAGHPWDKPSDLESSKRGSQPEAHRPEAPYYFYQSLLHYYLASLDIRILKAAFGNFASFPSTLLPRVEHVSTGHIVDQDLRKRMKYLSHLPDGCEVGFLECDWTDVVSPEILTQFKSEMEKRRQRNREKEIKEERERVRAEKMEDDARWATALRKRPSVDADPFAGLPADHFAPSSLDASNASPPWPLRQGSSFGPLASPSTSPSAPRTVWGTALVTPASADGQAPPVDHEVDDGWRHSWDQELQAEHAHDELVAHVQAASLHDGTGAEGAKQAGMPGRKKKAKKITLMSTTARRAA